MRALLAAVLALITSELRARMPVSIALSVVSLSSFSLGRYFGSAVRVAISCAKLSTRLSKLSCAVDTVLTGSAPAAGRFAADLVTVFARLP